MATGTLCALAGAGAPGETGAGGAWQPAEWHGERAFVSTSGEWRAIVSVARERLVYFGAAGGDRNLLFVPDSRDAAAGWGGHRIWLGPQATWPGGWPPPAAWEHSAAEAVRVTGDLLELTEPEAGDGWPRIHREYSWRDGALHCAARLSGGTRAAQIIHILQVPSTVEVGVQASPSASVPRGYVQVHLGRTPDPQAHFQSLPEVTERKGGRLTLRFDDRREKLGFVPQPIEARNGGTTLELARGPESGHVAGMPDEGFTSQVYLGSGDDRLIEIEQLSPLFAPGGESSFEVVLTARRNR